MPLPLPLRRLMPSVPRMPVVDGHFTHRYGRLLLPHVAKRWWDCPATNHQIVTHTDLITSMILNMV